MSNERKPTVALIFGGRGHECEVSIKGKEKVFPLIDRNKFDPYPIFIDKSGRWLIGENQVFPSKRGFFCPETKEFYKADCAFPLLHGDFGEDGRVQGALECADIPYVGCDSQAGAVCRDKSFVKTLAHSLGIPTLPHLLILRGEGLDYALRLCEGSFDYPMFIKPCRLGSSVGASSARGRRELVSSLTRAFCLGERVIVEPCLDSKRELECGYFAVKGKELFTNPGEILLDGLYDYEKKYLSGTKLSVRADLDSECAERIREYSRRLARALSVRGLCRVDFFLSGGQLYFNEINTMPGFTGESLYLKMIETEGYSAAQAINMLVESALITA